MKTHTIRTQGARRRHEKAKGESRRKAAAERRWKELITVNATVYHPAMRTLGEIEIERARRESENHQGFLSRLRSMIMAS